MQVRLELNMYFDKMMCMVNNTHLDISTDVMHQCVVSPAALKTMMHMLSNKLDKRIHISVPRCNKGKSSLLVGCHH